MTGLPLYERGGSAGWRRLFAQRCSRGARLVPVVFAAAALVCTPGRSSGEDQALDQRFAFAPFSVDDGLPHNFIRAMEVDHEGPLWIGTQLGLARHRAGTFERMGLDGAAISAIAATRREEIWVGTAMDGLWSYRGGQWYSHAEAPGLPSEDTSTTEKTRKADAT